MLFFLDRLSAVFAGVVDGLCDPKRRRRVALALICVYAAAWTTYGVIVKSSQDVNGDMAEMVIWGREPALGYPKHPPFLAFVVKLWFSIFPFADWAFTLLAVVTVSAGLYLAFELCGIWLDGEKRAAAPFVLTPIPFYNFLGLKFDQNSALIPLWALAMLAFMRSLETRRIGWSVLTGLAAAAAMLTKYWSGFLLVALALAALLDSRRGVYFRSAAPWITVLVFVLAVLPHAYWLVHENFPPLTWIAERRMAQSDWDFIRSFTEYCLGTIGYSAWAFVFVALLIHPSNEAVRDSWLAIEPARRPATLLFWTPLVLPVVVALAAHIALLSLWNAPALNLLPVMMLASPLVIVSRIAVMRLVAIITVLTLIAVVGSPLSAFTRFEQADDHDIAYPRLAAAAIESQWRETTDAPLRLVAGPFTLVSSAAFYMADQPSTFSNFSSYLSPWVTPPRIARQGIAIICPADQTWCLDQMNALTAAGPSGRRSEVTLTPLWLGFPGDPKRFVIATVPPRS